MKYDGIKYDYLTFGTRGTIYVNKEQESCIKLFNRETKPLDRTNKILRKIKNLNLVNIYKIQEIIYEQKFVLKKIIGYKMKYYEPVMMEVNEYGKVILKEKPLIFFPMDYVLKNVKSLFETFYKLYTNNIFITDFSRDNIILTNDGIVIIDVDNYDFITPLTKLKKQSFQLYRSYFWEQVISSEISRYCYDISSLELCNYINYSNPNLLEEMSHFPTIYDYIVEKNKEYQESKKVM